MKGKDKKPKFIEWAGDNGWKPIEEDGKYVWVNDKGDKLSPYQLHQVYTDYMNTHYPI